MLPDQIRFFESRSANFPASANMTLVHAGSERVLFDAGGSGADNHAATKEALASEGHALGDIASIYLTHAHADHSGGVSLVRSVHPDVAIVIHPHAKQMIQSHKDYFDTFDFPMIRDRYPDETALERQYCDRLQQFLATGACPFEPFGGTTDLDEDKPVHVGPFSFRVLMSEGHAPGHAMFYEPEAKILIAGDIIGNKLSWHAPSSGGVTAYLDALERAAALEASVVLPAHGSMLTGDDGQKHIRSLVDKLHRREDKLIGWLGESSRTFAQLCSLMVGGDGPLRLFPSVPMLESHLQRLEKRGAIRRSSEKTAADQWIELVR